MASNLDNCMEVCRACLSTNENLKNLFSTQINGTDLDVMFSECVGSQVDRDDGLPSFMCDNCLDNLQIAYNFRELCRASEQVLRNACVKTESGSSPMEIKTECFEEEIFAEEIVPDVLATNSEKGDPRAYINTSEKFDDDNPESDHSQSDSWEERTIDTRHSVSAENLTQQPSRQRGRQRVKPSTFKCGDCDQEFAAPRSFVDHIQKEHVKDEDNMKFSCEHCPMSTSRLKILSDHVKCHAEQKSSQCDICKQTFETLSHLRHHFNQKHSTRRPYVCLMCRKGTVFSTARRFLHHLVTKHTDEPPETNNCLCSECGKVCKYPSFLREHMLSHSKKKSFACPQCPKQFPFSFKLNLHMRTHVGLKLFPCDQCDSKFASRNTLIDHKRIHSGERPFPCEICDMRFTTSTNRDRHMLRHTGEKPFKCDHCDRAFTQKGSLTNHLRKHLGDQIYKCEECGMGFPLQRELKEHYKVHFGKNQNFNKTNGDHSVVDGK